MSGDGAPTARPRTRRRGWIAVGLLVVAFAALGWGPIVDEILHRPAEESGLGFLVRMHRFDEGTMPRFMVPAQPCPACRRGQHGRCAQGDGLLDFVLGTRNEGALSGASLIFPDPSVETAEAGVPARRGPKLIVAGRELVEITVDDFTCPCCE